MGSSSRSSQTQAQSTVQTDRRIGASDNAIVAAEGSRIGSPNTSVSAGRDLTVQTLDPETIAGAFGLSETVVEKLSALAGETVQGGQNLAERISGQTTAVVERLSDSFGRQVSDLATTQVTGGASQFSKLLVIGLVAVSILVGIFLWKRRK
jgi:LPXTG-motif cell wall-anchored protein